MDALLVELAAFVGVLAVAFGKTGVVWLEAAAVSFLGKIAIASVGRLF